MNQRTVRLHGDHIGRTTRIIRTQRLSLTPSPIRQRILNRKRITLVTTHTREKRRPTSRMILRRTLRKTPTVILQTQPATLYRRTTAHPRTTTRLVPNTVIQNRLEQSTLTLRTIRETIVPTQKLAVRNLNTQIKGLRLRTKKRRDRTRTRTVPAKKNRNLNPIPKSKAVQLTAHDIAADLLEGTLRLVLRYPYVKTKCV